MREAEQTVHVPSTAGTLEGTLVVPAEPHGAVVFAHGSGSSRFSPRNRFVAGLLQARGLATLLVDLLTKREEAVDERTAHLRFDVDLLAARLSEATQVIRNDPRTAHLPIGYFGASTGAAAALIAAAAAGDEISAVVSRGGRPDLAGDALPRVTAATLLIVGSRDEVVLELNQRALAALRAHKDLAVVPGATHLFEEPGALEEVARLAGGWFEQHCTAMHRRVPIEEATR
ncbi:MAG: dienelactone hydrolase family protein [Deltaproteobacteria bacterium]|nr:dienelactone hydrolase family protein [Deltaproteobacteria bacterium]